MRVTLFLMSYKGYSVLKSIIKKEMIHLVDKVIVGRDKDTINDYSFEIVELCEQYGLTFYDRKEQFEIQTAYAIAISWRWLIKEDHFKLLVIHDSLLPRYRGFAPLVSQLINGEKEIGATALFATKDYDKGDIILQRMLSITYPIKIQEAIEKVAELYKDVVINLLSAIQKGSLTSKVQVEKNATYSIWRDDNDYFINWKMEAGYIKRFIDSVGFPYLGAKTTLGEDVITVVDAVEVADVKIEIRDCGKVIFIDDDCPVIICGKGLLKILEAHFDKDGKWVMEAGKFRLRFK